MQFLLFLGSFLGHSGVFGVNQKSAKISINTYRMILILRQLNSLGETFSLDINLVLSKFCKKNPFDLNIFLFHRNYGRKIAEKTLEPKRAKVCCASETKGPHCLDRLSLILISN